MTRRCPDCEDRPKKHRNKPMPGLIFCKEHGCPAYGRCRYPRGHRFRASPSSPGAVHRGMPFVVTDRASVKS